MPDAKYARSDSIHRAGSQRMAAFRTSLGKSGHEVVTTEFEWAVLKFQRAFERYCLQVANAAGLEALSFSELELLIVVCLQEEPRAAAQIARQMNEDAVNLVHYGLGKLAACDLVRKARGTRAVGGKTFVYSGTDKGRKLVDRYVAIRHDVLTEQTRQIEKVDERMFATTKFLSLLASVYDESGRVAATHYPLHTA